MSFRGSDNARQLSGQRAVVELGHVERYDVVQSYEPSARCEANLIVMSTTDFYAGYFGPMPVKVQARMQAACCTQALCLQIFTVVP